MNWIKKTAAEFAQEKIEEVKDWNNPDRVEGGPVKCDEMNIPVTPDVYATLLSEANAAGVAFNGNQASVEGLTFDWDYDAEAQMLHVTCINRPFYISCPTIAKKINDLVVKAKGGL